MRSSNKPATTVLTWLRSLSASVRRQRPAPSAYDPYAAKELNWQVEQIQRDDRPWL